MRISFHGAAREVTGSCHLIEAGGKKILLDCGMIQGGKERHERNREPFPFDPASLDFVILSHAHIDHSGRLPLLRKSGFRGPILSTDASCDLARILLLDSAHIQEEDARWKIRRLQKKKMPWKWVEPLYTGDDAERALELFQGVKFDTWHPLGGVGRVRFVKAGHILGAAIVELELAERDGTRRVTFSGDLGVEGARLMGVPTLVERPDYLLIESTYGDRNREDEGDRTEFLYNVIVETAKRGGKTLIPSFAVGRTQEVLARINDLVESKRLSGIPIYVDSPMAVAATRAFAEHPDAYSDSARELLRAGDEPLDFPGLKLVRKVEDSMAINEAREPSVIISASGMCTAGRIKHHLRHNLSDPRASVIFVGYQAQGSLGRHIKSGTTPVRIFGDWHPVRARVHSIQGFSAHADRDELLQWYEGLGGVPKRTFVVHGEEEVSLEFGDALEEKFQASVAVPRRGQTFELD